MKKTLVTNSKFIIFLLASAWMIGISIRMIIGICYNNHTVYFANNFDLFFDWIILLLLGCALLIYSIYLFLLQKKPKRIGVYETKKN